MKLTLHDLLESWKCVEPELTPQTEGLRILAEGELSWSNTAITWKPTDSRNLIVFDDAPAIQLSQWTSKNGATRKAGQKQLHFELRSGPSRLTFSAPIPYNATFEDLPRLKVHPTIALLPNDLASLMACAMVLDADVVHGTSQTASEQALLYMRDVFQLEYSEGLAARHFPELNGWAYVDMLGRIALPGPFLEARAFSEKRAAVRTSKGWGFIDREGNSVGPENFERVRDFRNGTAKVWPPGHRRFAACKLRTDGHLGPPKALTVLTVLLFLLMAPLMYYYFSLFSTTSVADSAIQRDRASKPALKSVPKKEQEKRPKLLSPEPIKKVSRITDI